MGHLWTNAPAPWEYVEFQLRKNIYHCTPQEFDQIPMKRLLNDLTCIAAEAQVNEAEKNTKRKSHGA